MNAKILAFVIYFIYFVLAFIEAIIYLLLHNLHDCIFILLLRSICTPMEHPIISQNMTLSKYICKGNRNHDSIFFTFELSNLKMF